MKNVTSREIRLVSRPRESRTAANFAIGRDRTGAAERPSRCSFVISTCRLDPYMRGRMNDGKSYVPPSSWENRRGRRNRRGHRVGCQGIQAGDAVTFQLGLA